MKLLSQKDAQSKKKLENDALIGSNMRLRKMYHDITQKLNTVKDSYAQDKLDRLADFEKFLGELQVQKAKVLGELAGIQKLVEDTKEIYYSLIIKQDALQEVKYKIDEENKKLDLREIFIKDLEERFRNKTTL